MCNVLKCNVKVGLTVDLVGKNVKIIEEMRKDNLSKKLLITSVGYKHNITKHATCLSEKEKNQKKNKIIFKLEI